MEQNERCERFLPCAACRVCDPEQDSRGTGVCMVGTIHGQEEKQNHFQDQVQILAENAQVRYQDSQIGRGSNRDRRRKRE